MTEHKWMNNVTSVRTKTQVKENNYFLRLGIQHPFKLHVTLLTKLIVDVVSHRFQGPPEGGV